MTKASHLGDSAPSTEHRLSRRRVGPDGSFDTAPGPACNRSETACFRTDVRVKVGVSRDCLELSPLPRKGTSRKSETIRSKFCTLACLETCLSMCVRNVLPRWDQPDLGEKTQMPKSLSQIATPNRRASTVPLKQTTMNFGTLE